MKAGDAHPPTCPFCRLIRQGRTVAIQGTMAALKDRYPATEGHLPIVPLRHTPDGFAMNDRESDDPRGGVRGVIDGKRGS